MYHAWIASGPVLLLILSGVQSFLLKRSPRWSASLAESLTLSAAVLALMSLLLVIGTGEVTVFSFKIRGISLGIQYDTITSGLTFLVTFVGWVVVRFSRTYLEGEAGRARFLGWAMATLASVLAFLQAASLLQMLVAWICTSLFLHQLLLFYPERRRARRAAHKKFLFARVADLALFCAFAILAAVYQTLDIGVIRAAIGAGNISAGTQMAAVLIALAACIKSAQLPVHGWLTEIMEVPTPVSALLHAGVINAGGVLLVRLADVVSAAPEALTLLVLAGSVSALVASAVMLTQPAVKNSLAWSTVSQMGFMMIQCGLGLFALAFFHIIMHSLYKAYAFLTAGNTVKDVKHIVPRDQRAFRLPVLLTSISIGAAVYLVLNDLMGGAREPLQAQMLGSTLVLASGYLVFRVMERASAPLRAVSALGVTAATTAVYILVQRLAFSLTEGLLPAPGSPDAATWLVAALLIMGFILLISLQAALPSLQAHPALLRLKVHLQNGLYIHTLVDRGLTPFMKTKGLPNV